MRTADKRYVRALQRVDPDLSIQWNRGRGLWEVFATRKLLPPSQRKRFIKVCVFYWDGKKCVLREPKPIDRWHVMFWTGPNGEYRDLDMNLVDEVQRRDMWQMGRPRDIWDSMEADQNYREEKNRRDIIQNMKDRVIDQDGPLRRDIFSGDGNITRRMRHHPLNWMVKAPWKK